MKPVLIPKDEQFHLTFAVKKGRILKIGRNNYNKQHNAKRFGEYKAFKTSNVESKYIPCIHSECDVFRKLNLDSWSGIEVVNVRLNNKGNLRFAMPCKNCINVLNYFQPKRIFYSTSDGNYDELT
jgi:hypothetical protein